MENRFVLIVDRSSDSRATFRQFLARDARVNYQVEEVDSIAGARVALQTIEPDCLIFSSNLADGGPLELVEALRDETGQLRVPTVGLVANEDQETVAMLLRAGVDEYIVRQEASVDTVRLAVSNAIYRRAAQAKLATQQMELQRLYQQSESRAREAEVARAAAERASLAKDDFLAMLSHELRTPLTPVLSVVSSSLLDGNLSPDTRETFAMIQRNVELEARLIDDLLDLTQVASGRLAIERKPVDVHECIRGALGICEAAFSDRNIAVHGSLEAAESIVMGDFARLHQVLWNLLKNAAKFTPPGGDVYIETRNEAGEVLVTIRDNGIGIEKDRLDTVFGVFGGGFPQSMHTGLGLGLTISRAIVEAHGGKVTAESEGRDHGAVFCVRMPTGQSASLPPPSEPTETSERGLVVLVVEDHEDTRRVLSRALRRRGFGVAVADGVEAAVHQFQQSHPDVVVCDLGLPDGTGWDVMTRLRALGPVRAIAVSGYGMDHDVARSRDAGFLAHITKPVDFAQLESILARALRREPVGAI